MKVKIKKTSENAIIPTYANEGDVGMDITTTSRRFDQKFGYVEYGTGLEIEIPEGYFAFLLSRSSISDRSLIQANPPAVIDSGYRGELRFRLKRITGGKGMYDVGDKIGQLIILPYPQIELEEVDELSGSGRNGGAFGSTGE